MIKAQDSMKNVVAALIFDSPRPCIIRQWICVAAVMETRFFIDAFVQLHGGK